ncbi:16386_t:CDS:2, partial [Cetraspora pellucida]
MNKQVVFPHGFPRQGEIYKVYFSKKGKEIGKIRPAMVISNNIQNEFDDQIVVAPLTSEVEEQKLIEYFGTQRIENTPLPQIITKNLNPKFKPRPYQENAFRKDKHQLLFLMATGSGKTLMMAGLILYLYQQGYRNFLFFVNSTNIIDKTRDNFLNDTSIKYLFNKSISFESKKIILQEVSNFQNTDNDNINIVFSTIQGLHSRLNTPRENSLTYEDFQDQKIVLISDEAHHIN